MKRKPRDKSKDVVFRVWNASPHKVLALWPFRQAGGCGMPYCQSYMNIGQHGVADYTFCIRYTRPAKPAEYAKVLAELRKIGYKPHVIQRRNSK